MTEPVFQLQEEAVQAAPAQSVIALTEAAGAVGGFTIGMSLASFADGDNLRIPPVDIVALAIVNTLKNLPAEFRAELDRINTGVGVLSDKLNAGEDAVAALEEFEATTGVQGFVRFAQ